MLRRIIADFSNKKLFSVNDSRSVAKDNWMTSCTSGLTHIKKTLKMYVIDSHNLINIRVSHSGLDHLVTDFVTFLC